MWRRLSGILTWKKRWKGHQAEIECKYVTVVKRFWSMYKKGLIWICFMNCISPFTSQRSQPEDNELPLEVLLFLCLQHISCKCVATWHLILKFELTLLHFEIPWHAILLPTIHLIWMPRTHRIQLGFQLLDQEKHKSVKMRWLDDKKFLFV